MAYIKVLKPIYVHFLVCYLNYKMHGATINIVKLLYYLYLSILKWFVVICNTVI